MSVQRLYWTSPFNRCGSSSRRRSRNLHRSAYDAGMNEQKYYGQSNGSGLSPSIKRTSAIPTAPVIHEYKSVWRLAERTFAAPTAPISTASTVPTNDEVYDAFADAYSALSPITRVIIASPTHYTAAICRDKQDALTALPQKVGVDRWDMTGFVQTRLDVDFAISIPLNGLLLDDSSTTAANTPSFLKLRIYYDPTSHDCILVNNSSFTVHLTKHRKGTRCDVKSKQWCIVGPDIWRVSVGGSDKRQGDEQSLFDIRLLHKRFSVLRAGVDANPLLFGFPDRSHDGDEKTSAKRRKVNKDAMKISPAPAAKEMWEEKTYPSLEARLAFTAIPTVTHHEPLADLMKRHLAVIKSTPSICTQMACGLDPRTLDVNGPDEYTIDCFEQEGLTKTSVVFGCRHSDLGHSLLSPDTASRENTVAKMFSFGCEVYMDILRSAESWRHELLFLLNIDHENLVSLKAYDGRFFALYLEHLPKSLARENDSVLGPEDASRILRDMSSALAYLKTRCIVHNDIKPANIAYSPERGAVLFDFGLATTAAAEEHPGGTPWYLPPECSAKLQPNAAGDVWSLGVTMLYVTRNISYPERGDWRLRFHLMTETGSGHDVTWAEWLEEIAKARRGLDRDDFLEGIIYHMLDPMPSKRITAAAIEASFASGVLQLEIAERVEPKILRVPELLN
ncbi:hypothetical protein QQS21_004929 [Conoideocrella luteorostrata]|uniref:Protein kinase domain-containing protein n=1 Tax=Conoideocrella luteorostrata TaxID=1105319 RepID=A0AAJ0FV07_9HYPO|nr:hypothetical protein QQS21_004929 [Conoideocrella luteorostrata]